VSVNLEELTVYPLDLFPYIDCLDSFTCGKETYDKYIIEDASDDHSDNIGKVWLFHHEKDVRLAGYVTLAMSQIHKNDAVSLRELTSHSYIPGLLLGQMARDLKYSGKGLGKIMMDWVKNQAEELRQRIGCRLIILQSEEDKVKDYQRYGFVLIPPSKKKKNMMFYDLKQYVP